MIEIGVPSKPNSFLNSFSTYLLYEKWRRFAFLKKIVNFGGLSPV